MASDAIAAVIMFSRGQAPFVRAPARGHIGHEDMVAGKPHFHRGFLYSCRHGTHALCRWSPPGGSKLPGARRSPSATSTMKYFSREMVAAPASGKGVGFDAYCEHPVSTWATAATSRGEPRLPVPWLGVEQPGPQTHASRKMRSTPTVDGGSAAIRLSSATRRCGIWFDVDGRPPYFEVPDMSADFDDDKTADDYYQPYPAATLFRPGLA